MAGSVEPVGAIALDSRLAEEAGYSDDSATKPSLVNQTQLSAALGVLRHQHAEKGSGDSGR